MTCARCGSGIFKTDDFISLNKVWHKYCFTCYHCCKRLDKCTAKIFQGELFCDCCYTGVIEKLFKALSTPSVNRPCRVSSTPSCKVCPAYGKQLGNCENLVNSLECCTQTPQKEYCFPAENKTIDCSRRNAQSCVCIPSKQNKEEYCFVFPIPREVANYYNRAHMKNNKNCSDPTSCCPHCSPPPPPPCRIRDIKPCRCCCPPCRSLSRPRRCCKPPPCEYCCPPPLCSRGCECCPPCRETCPPPKSRCPSPCRRPCCAPPRCRKRSPPCRPRCPPPVCCPSDRCTECQSDPCICRKKPPCCPQKQCCCKSESPRSCSTCQRNPCCCPPRNQCCPVKNPCCPKKSPCCCPKNPCCPPKNPCCPPKNLCCPPKNPCCPPKNVCSTSKNSCCCKMAKIREVCTACCIRCCQKVYAAEKIVVSSGAFHTSCFSCYCCNKLLDVKNVYEGCGEIYCKQCYNHFFGVEYYGFGRLTS